MKPRLILIFALIFLFPCSYLISQTKQKEVIEEADLLLDMMEYKAAIINYLKALSEYPNQRDIRKNIGYAYFQLEKIDDALKYLKEELNLFPGNEDAYDLLVYILYRLNKLEEANKFLDRSDFSIRLTEENPHIGGLASFILGMHFKEIKKYGQAKEYFRKALEKGHDPVKCYVQLIDIDFIQGELDPAVRLVGYSPRRIIAEAIEKCDIQPEFYFMQGLRFFEKSKGNVLFFRWSINAFEMALRLNPYFRDSLFNLACISYNFKDYAKTSEYFRQILEIEPENADIKFYLDCALKKIDQSFEEKSISECPQMINFSRDFIDKPDREYKYQFKNDLLFVLQNISYLALEFIKKGKFEEGITRYRNGLRIYPESPELNFNLGTVFLWQNNFKEAERHALIALRRKYYYVTLPDFLISGKMNRYEREELLKKTPDGIHRSPETPLSQWTFDTAIKEGNYFSEAYDLLGKIYFGKGDLDKSLLAYKKEIELKHDDAMAHYNLGCIYWALNEWKKAEEEWKKAIKYEKEARDREDRAEIIKNPLAISMIVLKRPASYRAHKALGWLYLKKDLADKALKEFKKAIELEPDDPEPYYELGKIYHAKSESNEKYVREAIFYYEKYIYLGGKEEKEVKELLKSLK